MDAFDAKTLSPMLIGATREAFDDPDYIFEWKLDGERCLAYLSSAGAELRNKRNDRMLPKTPELCEIHTQVRETCVLDGELAVIKNGKTDFAEIQRRSLMQNPYKIEIAAARQPACFTAFDILYYKDHLVTGLPLLERKALLEKVVARQSPRFALSRFFSGRGVALSEWTKKRQLEGVVAKRKGSLYYCGKRTKDWIKIKHLLDDDFVVCGYIYKQEPMSSLVLGQYDGGALVYKGHVTLGVSGAPFRRVAALPRVGRPAFDPPAGNETAVWVEPRLVCTVRYMMKTPDGFLRHAVLKGLRDDKAPEDCIAVP